ncbi:hypothetical protein AVEN_207071-1 [Araneus ventricosus]|uniref:Uncharacterized protein n=1 Tax=Araneus ventricosus TaxID=182803 RepID=A0A4Y2GCB9_ARAVE|nr:hypothetical protein AVEN_207071-1 [Araneus ventricosus]
MPFTWVLSLQILASGNRWRQNLFEYEKEKCSSYLAIMYLYREERPSSADFPEDSNDTGEAHFALLNFYGTLSLYDRLCHFVSASAITLKKALLLYLMPPSSLLKGMVGRRFRIGRSDKWVL